MATANPISEGNFVLELNRVKENVVTKFREISEHLDERKNELLRRINTIIVSYQTYKREFQTANEKKEDLETTKLFLQSQLPNSHNKSMHNNFITQINTELEAIVTPKQPKLVTFVCEKQKLLTEVNKLCKLVERVNEIDYTSKTQSIISVSVEAEKLLTGKVEDISNQTDDDDVLFIPPKEPTREQISLVAQYQLPRYFYSYEDKPACAGCRGCVKPVVSLPEIQDIKTGEDEEIIFKSHAFLYRYVDKEWKEKGRGELKILLNNETGKHRILMRRDQIKKFCCNHFITPGMKLNPFQKSENSWMWHTIADFSEEEHRPETLTVRFTNTANSNRFKEIFDSASVSNH